MRRKLLWVGAAIGVALSITFPLLYGIGLDLMRKHWSYDHPGIDL